MPIKRVTYPVELKAIGGDNGDAGQVEAIVSVFNNVDLQGDRVMPGAFTKNLAEWKASGDPIPVVFSHDWNDLFAHIGVVKEIEQTTRGLRTLYALDIHDNPAAAQAFKLIKRRSLKDHSFAYEVVQEHRAKDGANELTELRIIEIGPTLVGANPETEVIAAKAAIKEVAAEEQAAADTNADNGIVISGNTSSTSKVGGSITFAGNTTSTASDLTKAGRRLSQATRTRLQAMRDELDGLLAEDAAEEDAPKNDTDGATKRDADKIETEKKHDDDREPPAKSIDEDLLRVRTRIEEMRATTGKT